MLTNEQALEIIRQHDACYVVWAIDKNAIIAVHPIPKDATAKERFSALAGMSTDYRGPTKGRFLASSTTTLQTLIDESKETERITTRVAIFNTWKNCTVDQLIDIIVNADFSGPMDVFHGTSHIIERLYKIFGPFLSLSQINRLDAFSHSAILHHEQEKGQKELDCYLCVLTNDPARLQHIWTIHKSRKSGWPSWSAFVDAAGDLATDNGEIIDHLISVVEKSLMFGPRFDAMVGLGKIGSNSGERAAKVILGAIYDSSEHVTAVRDCVVRRIRTPSSEWSMCRSCYHGYVDDMAYQLPSVKACRDCLGIGAVPSVAEPSGEREPPMARDLDS